MTKKDYNALLRQIRKFCKQLNELIATEFSSERSEVNLIEVSDATGPDVRNYSTILRVGFFIPDWDIDQSFHVYTVHVMDDYISGPGLSEATCAIMKAFCYLHNDIMGPMEITEEVTV